MRVIFNLQKYCSLGFAHADHALSAPPTPSSPIGVVYAEQVDEGGRVRTPSACAPAVGFVHAEQVAWDLSALCTPTSPAPCPYRPRLPCLSSSFFLSSSSQRLSFLTLLPPFLLTC